ncbi:lysylphosphatidylglycerol synthase transmembrane domain-containing protein [Evansella cellulosilytica]|uniref:Phosphatidylglycerol lysyltransferase n=1 Tax=Evansella cellulosilytica (strain ATCC 21833 / DSM 2522 / FERM P-1141 / JCM 9156 / N-4) TaxID=649639 RepID=E6TW86_EVAC2|nr:lysylphosphatidylglycerol synthase transmembrane domain-containing protein [Evansella cellulosilytica]ADU31042.1 hypothetical protein Bcell_2788 [Evansella cellulosilytica DSM 2522]
MKRLVLYSIGFLIITVLVLKSDTSMMYESFLLLGAKHFVFLIILQIFTILLINYQWVELAKRVFPTIRFKEMLTIQMIGTFAESITPAAKTGGEAVKVILLRKTFRSNYGEAIALVSVQKLISMLAFFPIATISFIFMWRNMSIATISVNQFQFYIIIIVTTSLFMYIVYKLKDRVAKIKELMSGFKEQVKKITNHRRNCAKQLLLSLIVWALFPVKAYFISMALQMNVNLLTISAVTFVAYLIALLPLTPGGIGTFEGAVIVLLQEFHIGIEEALIFAVILRFITYWFVILISFIYSYQRIINMFKQRKQFFIYERV